LECRGGRDLLDGTIETRRRKAEPEEIGALAREIRARVDAVR